MVTLKRLTVAFLAAVLLISAGAVWLLQSEFEKGQELLARGRWSEARTALRRYLWLHENDDRARMALAEAWARDDELPAKETAENAVALLDGIGDDSELAAQARLQSGRLRFLILHHPCRAEQDLRASLRHRPESFEANYMMWKLLDLTRRYYLAEPFFRRCLKTVDDARRERILREWYFSQFSTFSAASELDQLMGFAELGQPADALTEYKRLFAFAQSEPDCALNQAALADWAQEYHVEVERRHRLERAWELADATTAPFVYAVLFDILLEEGRFDEAAEVFRAWPEPRTGYDFWKRQGIYYAEITRESEAAVAACEAALAECPGPIDWQLEHRLAGLLVRTGRSTAAERVQTVERRLEGLMDVDLHRELREALQGVPSRKSYLKVARFYADIGRDVEARAWKDLAEHPGRRRSAGRRGPSTPGGSVQPDF